MLLIDMGFVDAAAKVLTKATSRVIRSSTRALLASGEVGSEDGSSCDIVFFPLYVFTNWMRINLYVSE